MSAALPDKQLFIQTLRVFINSPTEVDADIAGQEIVDLIEEYIDPEDGDRVESTQLTSFESDVEPDEQLIILARARNTLIRTRIKQCFDLAKEVDYTMHALRHRDDGSGFIPPYSHGDFMLIAKSILQDGEDPL